MGMISLLLLGTQFAAANPNTPGSIGFGAVLVRHLVLLARSISPMIWQRNSLLVGIWVRLVMWVSV